MQILFVDDREDMLNLFEVSFSLTGHQVKTARSGKEALAWMQRQPFDVVVLDMAMPGMDGLETLEKIRQLEHSRTVPVVVFSGQSTHNYLHPAFQLGADRWVSKPQSPQQLLNILKEVVADKQV